MKSALKSYDTEMKTFLLVLLFSVNRLNVSFSAADIRKHCDEKEDEQA